jgi:hypothetical protein
MMSRGLTAATRIVGGGSSFAHATASATRAAEKIRLEFVIIFSTQRRGKMLNRGTSSFARRETTRHDAEHSAVLRVLLGFEQTRDGHRDQLCIAPDRRKDESFSDRRPGKE